VALDQGAKCSFEVCKVLLANIMRRSDDPQTYHYLVPSNMFAVVALQNIAEIARDVYSDLPLANRALQLADEIDEGIHKYAVVEHKKYGKIYAYETDGCGKHNLMDDANVPSLLSIPYLGYSSKRDADGAIAANTRKFIWSSDNHWFFSSNVAHGIGSPHTGPGRVWPMSLIMAAMTTDDPVEINQMVEMVQKTDAGSLYGTKVVVGVCSLRV
jgi:meiotically up-regulated gene 157 (Mug157) protein